MRLTTVVMLMAFAATSAMAHDSIRLTALDKRVKALEDQVARLGAAAAPLVEQASVKQRVDGQRMKARERMRKDSAIYTREQLGEIETLYQVANKQWRSQEGKDSLEKLIKKFDKANRTGCALLYLGQMSKGKDREDYLLRAIDGFSDCYYGDGVQVGAYARYYLAYHYKENGKRREAEALFNEIKESYPDAISHKGRLLADSIDH
jgi:hypothetical protein